MPTDDTFLAAVLADPDDDGPRLVYADWLDEQGQGERAEFIRCQVELAKRAEDDPRRPDLAARERQLLIRHAKGWARPVRPLVTTWQFCRGFVEQVRVGPQAFLDSAEALFVAAPVRGVRFSTTGIRPDTLLHLPTSPHLGRLAGIDLGDLWLDFSLLRAFLRSTHWPRLRSLAVRGWFGREGSQLIADTEQHAGLTELDLSGSPLEPATVGILAESANLQRLTTLRWRHCPPATQAELFGSPLLARLHTLDLGDCLPAAANRSRGLLASLRGAFAAGLRGQPVPTGRPVPALNGLRTLRLSRSVREPAARAWCARLLASRTLSDLTTLDLTGNGLGPDVVTQLIQAGPWPRLTNLLLDGNLLRDDGVRRLAQPGAFPVLTVLHLRSPDRPAPAE
jgi:uncharacterized protein (TIGR02996 family)